MRSMTVDGCSGTAPGVDGQCYAVGGVAFGEKRRLLHVGLGVVVVGRDRCHQQRMLQRRSQSLGNGAGGNADTNAAALLECLRGVGATGNTKGEGTWKILAQQRYALLSMRTNADAWLRSAQSMERVFFAD